MKIVKFTAFIVIISLLFLSCEKPEDSLPPYVYEILIKIENTKGNNLLTKDNINHIKNSISIKGDYKVSNLKNSINFVEYEKELFLKISSAHFPPEKLNEISYIFKNRELFNNDKNQELKVLWKFNGKSGVSASQVFLNGELLSFLYVQEKIKYFVIEI